MNKFSTSKAAIHKYMETQAMAKSSTWQKSQQGKSNQPNG
jgi:hypothetical protein